MLEGIVWDERDEDDHLAEEAEVARAAKFLALLTARFGEEEVERRVNMAVRVSDYDPDPYLPYDPGTCPACEYPTLFADGYSGWPDFQANCLACSYVRTPGMRSKMERDSDWARNDG